MDQTCPVFGVWGQETRRQSIAVTVDERHYVTFSNGVTIHGWKWVPLELLGLAMWLVIFIGLSFLLLHVVAWIMMRFDARLSHGILHFWKKEPRCLTMREAV